jgi:hypothetical protein
VIRAWQSPLRSVPGTCTVACLPASRRTSA